MDFQIKALPETAFAHLFQLTDAELADRQARRQVVTASPGTPCRVSMRDAGIGETVLLLHYEHQPADSPFRASHAVFVRQGATQAEIAVNEVPQVIQSRLVPLRYFDRTHMMIDAEVVPGTDAAAAIARGFDSADVAYAHIHYAKPGCFAARVERVG